MSVNEPYDPDEDQTSARRQSTSIFSVMQGAVNLIGALVVTLVVGVVLWEIASPANASLYVRLKEKMGIAEAKAIEAQLEADRKLQQAIALSNSQVKAYENAYTQLYSTHAGLIQRAYDLEIKLADRQTNAIGKANWARMIAANFADIGCLLGQTGLASENAQDAAEMAAVACPTAAGLKEGLVSDYTTLISEHRSDLPEQWVKGLPKPEDMLNDEYERLVREYQSTAGQ